MYKNLTITAVLGMLAIILGAFGAHALKTKLSEDALKAFETAVRYQLFHVLVLLIVNLNTSLSTRVKQVLSTIFIIGVVLFSGSIYAICLLSVPVRFIWFITPLGGLMLVVAWALLVYTFLKKIPKN